MVLGVSILLWFTIGKGNGVAGISRGLSEINPKLAGWVGPPGVWPLFCLVFLTSVAPFGMPQLLQKFYAIKDDRSIRIGMVASTGLAVLIGGTAYFTGATTRLFLSPEIAPNAFAEGKPVFDRLMPELLANVVPESLSVLILLLVLSASMSTLAALVLISSAAVVKDVYAGFINPSASDARLTLLMRGASLLFVLASVVLAARRLETIVAILSISWGAIGAVFLGPFVWGLLSRRGESLRSGVVVVVLGLGTCIVLFARGSSSPEAGTIGMLVSLAVNPVFSMLVPHRSEDSSSES